MMLFWTFNHFVVLEGIKGDRAYINDPAEGPRRISLAELAEGYSGACFAFEPGPEFQPGGEPPNLVRGLTARFGQALRPLAFAALATLALIIPGLALPAILKAFIDEVLIRRDEEWVAPLLIGLGAVALIQAALTWLQRVLFARMETKLSIVATARFFWHVATLPMLFFSQRYAGDIANRVGSNDAVARLLSGELAINVVNVLTMVIYLLAMLAYDPGLTVVALGAALLHVLVLVFSGRAREAANRRWLRESGQLSGASINGVQIIETLKANAAEQDFFARWSGMQANVLSAQQQMGLVGAVAAMATVLISQLSGVVVLGFGGLRVAEGVLTIGGLVAFQSLAASFAQPVEGLVQFGANLQRIKGDIARLDDVLNYKPDERTRLSMREARPLAAVPPPRGSLELDGITFGYNVTDPPLIKEFSLSVTPGRRVALVGGSGSGKSTIAKIACGLLQPWSGTVRIDGEPLDDISPARLAEIVSHVDQEVALFEGSVRENVALWDPTVEEREIVRALRDAAIQDLFASQPLRYDTPVDEDGRNFSGGQRQRLELARALVRNPAVLILDEATAALDPVTELAIDDGLRRRGCTCLIVAHRLSTIRDADEIIVLDDGHIVQRGTHKTLLAEEGLYRTLVKTD